ncbi:hypothetical protein BH11MYX3_BH11MYX3_31180 [soil metagenome]
MRTPLLQALLFATTVTACTGTGTGTVQYSADVQTPELVEISPGVQVIADYDEPVFYSDNYYWRFDGGVWYRSHDHRRDWVRIESPPERVRRIDRPTAYIHYHANARAEVRDHRSDHDYQPQPAPPVVREHGGGQPYPQPAPPPPAVREERRDDRQERKEDRRDERMDRKEDKREEKQERKEERRDEKQDRKEEKREEKQDRKDDKRRGR